MQFTDSQRRRRLAARHHLAATASNPVEAVASVAAFHSADPLTPYLGLRARIPGFAVADLDGALWEKRELWRLHAMRRTQFLVPTGTAASFLVGTTRTIADRERARLESWVSETMPESTVTAWLEDLGARIVETLAGGGEWTTKEISAEIPELATEIRIGSGRWVTTTPVASRLLYLLAMEGRILRTRPAGSWRSSQYRWAATSWWWQEPPVLEGSADEMRASTLSAYLATHGPATMDDIRWWTGWRVTEVRQALADLGAGTAQLEGGEGFVLPGDVEVEDPADQAAVSFLPGLDPTPMGWKGRDWYVGGHGPLVFDRNGNVGPTVWLDGRIVGGWGQTPDGTVRYRLLEKIDGEASARVADEAQSVTEWLGGQIISTRFPSPLEKELSGR